MTTAAAQEVSSAISLKGSTDILAEYFEYAVHNIIYQRGIYPAETFERTQKYGLTLFVSTESHIKQFVDVNIKHAKEWIEKSLVKDLSLLMLDAKTHEVLERWNFRIIEDAADVNVVTENGEKKSKKPLKVIQAEIAAVLRQITSAISFLPLLDCRCLFDVQFTLKPDAVKENLPPAWEKLDEKAIPANPQTVAFRGFSTGIHQVDSGVTFKLNEGDVGME